MNNDGITILSLFDGMSCGQIALQRAGIKVKQYFAAEIDKHAIAVTQHNYPNTIQLGDVTKVSAKDLPKIDLLIGGSPCQGFSFAGKQLAFDDPRSKLFFEYVRLLNECKPTYFLLENVKMKREFEIIISKYMGIAPIEINSALLSAQSRPRLYWTNIAAKPYGLFGDMECTIPQPKDKGILLKDILESDVPENYYVTSKNIIEFITDAWRLNKKYTQINGEKAITQRARQYSNWGGDYIAKNGKIRRLTPLECERLQTVPDNYTATASDTQRYKMLGNGWTIDVIAYILSFANLIK